MNKIVSKYWIFVLPVFLFTVVNTHAQIPTDSQSRASGAANLQSLQKQLQQDFALKKQTALLKAARHNWPVRLELPDGKIIQLQDVTRDGIPIYYATLNYNAAVTVRTDGLWSGGLLGLDLDGLINGTERLIIGEWDGGPVRFDHLEFTDQEKRIFLQDRLESDLTDNSETIISDSISSHASHVAGTLIAAGVQPETRGMANQAALYVWDFNRDIVEAADAASNGMLISNHSYGPITGWFYNFFNEGKWTWFGGETSDEDMNFGWYSSSSQQWDMITSGAPYYLPVFAAGNDRGEHGPIDGETYYVWVGNDSYETRTSNPPEGDGPYDTMAGPALSKNVLTVGAIDDITPMNPEGAKMSNFSSWGPTDDGRVKPDIVANGVMVYSTEDTANNHYGYKSGTSMAAPNATGSLALLQELSIEQTGIPMKAATLKGVAIHTATDSGSAGPDYEWGWGVLNSEKAAQFILDATMDSAQTMIEDSLVHQESITYEINVTSGQPLVATLSWTDPPGDIPPRMLNPRTPVLVNDLDMIIQGSDETVRSWALDPDNPSGEAVKEGNSVDNIEQVVIENPAQDTYLITIDHKGSLENGLQHFSLLINAPQSEVSNRSPRIAHGFSTITIDEDFPEFVAGRLDSIFFDTSPDIHYSVASDGNSVARIDSMLLYLASVTDYFGPSEIVVTAADSQYSRKDTLLLNIQPVNDPPEPFSLNYPLDGYYNRQEVQGTFEWAVAEDVDNEEVNYILTFSATDDSSTIFTTAVDTILSVHLLNLDLPRETPIQWNVLAVDEQDTTFSSNGPFLFTLSDELEILNYAGGDPSENVLFQNYPNPFKLAENSYTSIGYGLTQPMQITITIYDLNGRVIRQLVNGFKDQGWHKEQWDGRNNAGILAGSGIYFYRIETPGFIDTKKLVFLK